MLIAADSIESLNTKIQEKIADGMYLFGAPTILPSTQFDSDRYFQLMSDTRDTVPGPPGAKGDKGDEGDPSTVPGPPGAKGDTGAAGLSAYQTWLNLGHTGTEQDFLNSIAGTRQKSEAFWSGLSIALTAGTTYNLINILKGTPTTAGQLAPFFRIADNKLWPFNSDTTMTFKLNVTGVFTGASQARSLTINFVGTNGNTLVQNRPENAIDTMSFATFFSVDKNGQMATNGSVIDIIANGGVFTINSVLLVAEQVVKS